MRTAVFARTVRRATGLSALDSGRRFMAFQATRSALGTVVPFKLSDIGEGTLEVQILQWFVKPGDKINAFDKICEVQTDKATDQITSPFDGIVTKLHAEVGGVAKVGHALIDVETEDADVIAAAGKSTKPAGGETASGAAKPAGSSAAPKKDAATEGSTARATGEKPLATPAVRRIAMEHNVDLRDVPASGKQGRVMKDDILAFLEGGAKPSPSAATTTAAASSGSAAAARHVATTSQRQDRVEVIAGVKKAMVKSMNAALKIPAFGASDEIEMTGLIAVRDQLRPLALADLGLKLSYMPFFIKAASLALDRYPSINAHTNEECTEVTYKGSHHIGFAMDTPTGLIVPNIKDVQDKSIFDIAVDMNKLMEKGKANAFSKADLTGGTFTLSNIGSIGATYTSPVIFPPQVAIGALGRMVRVPRFDASDKVYAANIVNVSWSADHRVVDGATMVRFGNQFKDYIEKPALMLSTLK
jgi:2-oxoisovalerate dehydrogenase E2 component (dihydrolipoyl transacylase)